MKIVQSGFEILRPHQLSNETKNSIYRAIERAGRTCYKSEDKITPESAAKFVQSMVKSGHEAMLEHASMTVKFTVDRGVTHEMVRHRIASFAQESTRYCNYGSGKFDSNITYISIGNTILSHGHTAKQMEKLLTEWEKACKDAEKHYMKMLQLGATPEIARSVLNNSTKADLVVTMNMREWRHFFKLRTVGETGKPHPQMAEVAVPLLRCVADFMPELFGDILEELRHESN